MTTIGLPDATADPAGFVLAVCDRVEADAQGITADSPKLAAFVLAQVALWRSIVERHVGDHICSGQFPCPDLLAVVAAARAYLGGQ